MAENTGASGGGNAPAPIIPERSLKLKISKKAYVFDVRKKFAATRSFAVKKRQRRPRKTYGTASGHFSRGGARWPGTKRRLARRRPPMPPAGSLPRPGSNQRLLPSRPDRSASR